MPYTLKIEQMAVKDPSTGLYNTADVISDPRESLLESVTADVTVLPAGSDPTAEFDGDGSRENPYAFNFGIPRGIDKITTQVTMLDPGATPTGAVTGIGSTSNPYVFKLGIPRGQKGDKGDAGSGNVSYFMGQEPDNSGNLTWEIIRSVVVNAIYPIGSIYITTTETNPSEYFGPTTTWEQIKERFLLAASDITTTAANRKYDPNNVSKNEGGQETVSLSAENNGPHTHSIIIDPNCAGAGTYPYGGVAGLRVSSAATGSAGVSWSTPGASGGYTTVGTIVKSNGNDQYQAATSGEGTPFSIMPPYTVVYVWRRTG